MKAFFFNDSEKQINTVYSAEQKRFLNEKFGVPAAVYGKKDMEKISDAVFLFSTWGMPSLTSDEIRKFLPDLKAVFYAAGSVKYFAESFMNAGVRIFSAWQANAVPVAECAVSQILLSTKGFWYLTERCKRDYAGTKAGKDVFPGNFNAKVGILGYGAIAKLVVRELVRHDLKVYVFAPDFGEADEKETGARKADLEFIFSECDVISNHIPDNEYTKGIICRNLIARLKPYSTFINTGRGAQVDESALMEKLASDETVTALLDVTFPEPPEKGSAFYTLPNAVLTPHFAGSSGREVHRMAQYMIEDAVRVSEGKVPEYEVLPNMLTKMA